MRSPLGSVLNLVGRADRAPVPYTSRRDSAASLGLIRRADGTPTEAALDQMTKSGTLYAIVSGLAEDIAGIRWRLYRSAGSGRQEDREEVPQHQALALWNRPNQFMTGQEYREIEQQWFDLVGESWTVQVSPAGTLAGPIAMWPLMPHKMAPKADADRYLAGYTYTDPDGRKIPLDVTDILFMRRPNPKDYYRGLGPVQAMMLDLGLATYSRQWNLNFFRNGAEPGGVVELPLEADDDSYDEMVEHWREQHQGVQAAHRVAVLEAGAKWVDRKITHRDMEFVKTLEISNEQIREAYRYPVNMLGRAGDVNRATAEAGRAMYAQNLLVPRLERWKGLANEDYLPLFGQTTVGMELDYDNPVEKDAEKENASRDSKVAAAVALVGIGFDPLETLAAFELPLIPLSAAAGGEAMAKLGPRELAELVQKIYVGTPDKLVISADEARDILNEAGANLTGPAPLPPAAAAPALPQAGMRRVRAARSRRALPRAAEPGEDPAAADLSGVQEDWEAALEALMAEFGTIARDWQDELAEQIEDAVDDEDTEALAALVVAVGALEEAVIDAMSDLTDQAAERMSDEAAEQDVLVTPVGGDMDVLGAVAVAASGLIAAGYAYSAGREALRRTRPGAIGAEVAGAVRTFLEGLADVAPRDVLGGSLTAAQNAGRIATLRAAPVAAYYANETLDKNTCDPCRAVDGKWLGNDLDSVEEVYPSGGYRDCRGRERCRGTVVAVWRPETVDED